MADGISALLLKAEDNNRWAVILHQADGGETTLSSATPAEHLIAASEIDYSAYRREIRNLREHHSLLEERLEVSQADFEDFVAEALLLPSMIRDIDPVGYFVLAQLIDQSLRQEDDGRGPRVQRTDRKLHGFRQRQGLRNRAGVLRRTDLGPSVEPVRRARPLVLPGV